MSHVMCLSQMLNMLGDGWQVRVRVRVLSVWFFWRGKLWWREDNKSFVKKLVDQNVVLLLFCGRSFWGPLAWQINHNFLLKEKLVVWRKVHLRLVVEVLAIQGGIASVLEGLFKVGGGSSLDCCCWFHIVFVRRSYPFSLNEEQKGWDYERKSFGTSCEVSVLSLHSSKTCLHSHLVIWSWFFVFPTFYFLYILRTLKCLVLNVTCKNEFTFFSQSKHTSVRHHHLELTSNSSQVLWFFF